MSPDYRNLLAARMYRRLLDLGGPCVSRDVPGYLWGAFRHERDPALAQLLLRLVCVADDRGTERVFTYKELYE